MPISGTYLTGPRKEEMKKFLEGHRQEWLKRFTTFKPGEMLLTHNPMSSFSLDTLMNVSVSTWQDFDDPKWVPLTDRMHMTDVKLPGCYPVLYLEPYLEVHVSPQLHLMAKILVDECLYVCREDHLVHVPTHFKTLFVPKK